MAVELAKAYVQIVPSLRGAQGTITKELGGIASSSAMGGVGRNLGSKIVSGIGTVVKTGMVTTGVAAGGILTTALTRGFKRLSAFEQAEKSLQGMKLSAEQIAVVMENANAAVDGTAFGLDEAATAAKGLVAAGIEPGQNLERVLTLIGDSAAQAGTSMSDMGLVWQKVAAKGKLQGDEALQLMERGIPIFQMVADELGVTADEAMDLASKGQVSFETFSNAMENSFGGTALKMGETVSGSFQNVLAAAGRAGQGILSGPFADLPGLFTRVRDEINEITPTVTAVSDQTYKALKGVWEILDGKGYSDNLSEVFGDSTARVRASLVGLRDETGKVKTAFGELGQATVRELRPLTSLSLDTVLDGFDRLVSLGSTATQKLVGIGTSLVPVAGNLAQVGAILGGGTFAIIERLTPSFLDLADAVVKATGPMTGLLVPAAEVVVAVAVPLAEAIGWAADGLAKLPGPVLAAGAAFVMMSRGIGPIPTLLGSIKTRTVASGLETLGLKAMYARDGLASMKGGVAGLTGVFNTAKGAASGLGKALGGFLAANLPMLAITGIVAALAAFSGQSQKTKQHVAEIADSFDDLGRATEATRNAIIKNLADDDLLNRFEDIGIATNDVTEALMGNADAAEKVKNQLEGFRDLALAEGNAKLVREIDNVNDAYDKQADKTAEARRQQELQNRAKDGAISAEDQHAQAIENVIKAEQARQDQLLGVQDAALAARAAQRDYADTVERSAQVIADAGSTEREREAALDAIAKSTQLNATRAKEAGASQAELNSIIAQGKTDFYEQAAAAGMSTAAIDDLWKTVGMYPGDIKAEVDVSTENAWVKLGDLKVGIDETTGNVTIDGDPVSGLMKLRELEGAIDNGDGTVTINGESYPAEQTLDSYLRTVANSTEFVTIDGNKVPADGALLKALTAIRQGRESVTIGGKDYEARKVLAALKTSVSTTRSSIGVGANTASAEATLNKYRGKNVGTTWITVKANVGSAIGAIAALGKADGGIVEYFANGGLKEKHVAQIAPAGAWRVWAEPETGGEAYIPLATQKRVRSTEVLAEVARRFGYSLEKYENGGITTSAMTRSGVPRQVRLVVGGREFPAYMEEIADGRIHATPGVRAASDFVAHHGRYSRMGG